MREHKVYIFILQFQIKIIKFTRFIEHIIELLQILAVARALLFGSQVHTLSSA